MYSILNILGGFYLRNKTLNTLKPNNEPNFDFQFNCITNITIPNHKNLMYYLYKNLVSLLSKNIEHFLNE